MTWDTVPYKKYAVRSAAAKVVDEKRDCDTAKSWNGTARYGTVWYGMAWDGMVVYGWYRKIWYVLVWHIWYGMER